MRASREIDDYLLGTERRVIRVRQHWAVMAKDVVLTGLFLLVMVSIRTFLPSGQVIDNITFYLSLACVLRFSV